MVWVQMLSRTLPQLNILAVGFSLNMMVMMGTMFMALGAIIYVFQEQAIQAIEHLRSALTVVP